MRLFSRDSFVQYWIPSFLGLLFFGYHHIWLSGLCFALLSATASWVVRRAALAKPRRGLRLNSIQVSHFTEKIRWVLDAEGIPYTEEVDCGLLGVFLTGRTVPLLTHETHRLSIGNSPQILAYLAASYLPRPKPGEQPRRTVLAPPQGATQQQVMELCDQVDAMGVAVQRACYGRLLGAPGFSTHRGFVLKVWGDHPAFAALTPLWQRWLLRALFPLLRRIVVSFFGLQRRDTVAQADQLIQQLFARVEDMLGDGRRYLLGGDHPSLADITFWALAAPLVFPPEYGGRDSSCFYRESSEIPELRKFMDDHRATKAGQWVLKNYQEFRLKK